MPGSKDAKRDLIPHLTFPIPSLSDVPRPTDKEQRITTIIANLDKHHQTVRLSIIEAAKRKLDEHHHHQKQDDDADDDNDDEGDKMDICPPSLPAPDGMEVFLANINAPYHESMGDPCSSSPSPAPRAAAAPPNQSSGGGVRQKPPPVEMQLAREALAQIALYDAHAMPARKFYTDALSRCTRGVESVSSAAAARPLRASTGGGGGGGPAAAAAIDPRRVNSIGGPMSTPPSRVGSATFTAGRVDPRLATGSGSGPFNIPAAPSPAERESDRVTDPRLRRRDDDPRLR